MQHMRGNLADVGRDSDASDEDAEGEDDDSDFFLDPPQSPKPRRLRIGIASTQVAAQGLRSLSFLITPHIRKVPEALAPCEASDWRDFFSNCHRCAVQKKFAILLTHYLVSNS